MKKEKILVKLYDHNSDFEDCLIILKSDFDGFKSLLNAYRDTKDYNSIDFRAFLVKNKMGFQNIVCETPIYF